MRWVTRLPASAGSRGGMKRSLKVVGIATALILGGVVTAIGVGMHDYPARHFRAVHEGVLYRSAQPDAETLDRLQHRYGIRTVVSLRVPQPEAPWSVAEREWCQLHGVRLVEVPITRADLAARLKEVLAIATDPACRPVLVHCAHGKIRAGFVSAAYRLAVQGWGYDVAVAEAIRLGFTPGSKHDLGYERILRLLAAGVGWRQLVDEPRTGSPICEDTLAPRP